MANFTRRRRFVTRGPVLKVDAGLAPGTHVFELVVMDRAGNRSKPAQVKVEIVRSWVIGPLSYVPTEVVTRPPAVTGGISTPTIGTVRPRTDGLRLRRPPNR